MNRVFLSLALGCVVATAGFAQCDPDFSFPDGVAFGLSPDPVAGETFEDGYLGQDYADTIHMLITLDATELVGAPLPVDSIVIRVISHSLSVFDATNRKALSFFDIAEVDLLAVGAQDPDPQVVTIIGRGTPPVPVGSSGAEDPIA